MNEATTATHSAKDQPTRLVNLTPHAIHLRIGDSDVELAPSGTVARVDVRQDDRAAIRTVHGEVPAVSTHYGTVVGVPPPQPDTLFVVASPVAANSSRTDLCIPFDLVRDDFGRPLFCRALAFMHRNREQS